MSLYFFCNFVKTNFLKVFLLFLKQIAILILFIFFKSFLNIKKTNIKIYILIL